MNSFRWTAVANLFANVNEQLTVQLLPFYLIYCVGVDFRDVGGAYTMVAGGQVGAALVSVPILPICCLWKKRRDSRSSENKGS